MKNIFNKTLVVAAIALGLSFSTNTYAQDYNSYNNGYYNNGYGNNNGYNNDGYTDYQMFYNELAPYGRWLQDPNYGYVWMPRGVDRNFRPYFTNGNWRMTDMGNMWVSNYNWGWIPFHYGRWVHNSYYGWLWIPGRQWAPAWVQWRQASGYYGWSPMGPSVNINIGGDGGYYQNNYNTWWNFIPMGHLYTGNYSRYRYNRYNRSWFNRTTAINHHNNYNNYRFYAGPRANDVRRVTGRNVTVYNIRNVNARPNTRSRVSGSKIDVYRPAISRSTSRTTQYKPSSFERISSKRATQVERATTTTRTVNVKDNSSINNRTINNSRTTVPRTTNTTTIKRETNTTPSINRSSTQRVPATNSRTINTNRSSTINRADNNRTIQRSTNEVRRSTPATDRSTSRTIKTTTTRSVSQPARTSSSRSKTQSNSRSRR